MLDNNVNKNPQQIAFQTMQPNGMQQPQVPMEATQINPELLKEEAQDTYVANRVANTTDDPKAMMGTAALMLPTWLLITQGMDRFAKHSTGEYETTLQYKIGKFGDRVAESSFAKSGFMQTINDGFKSVGKFFKTKIIDNSRITRAMVYTPSLAENHMARANQIGMEAMQLFDYSNPTDSFLKAEKWVEDLDCYGATKEEIANFQKDFAKLTTKEAKIKFIQDAEFEMLAKYTREPAEAKKFIDAYRAASTPKAQLEALQDLKAFNWGFRDFAHLKLCKEATHEHIHEIFEACCKANKKMFARDWGSNHNAVTRFCTKAFGREVYASEVANKLFAELQYLDLSKPENKKFLDAFTNTGYLKHVPKSTFAKYLNKYTHLITEGATNRVAGGKAVALIQAWFIAEALYKSFKAEGGLGEKGKTFAERFIELIAMFACIPLALKLMHGVGGLQYAGMTKEQVAAYRQHLAEFNQKAMEGGFKTKAEWKSARKVLKDELKAGVKNPFVNLAKRVGRIVSVGLEQIRPWDKADIADVAKDGTKTYRKGIKSKLRDLWRHPKFGLKQMSGYPMRIGLGLLLIMPILTKTAVKGSHLIFGKPKHSLLDEDKEKEQAEKAAQAQQVGLPDELKNNPELAAQIQQIQQMQQTQQQSPVQYGPNGQSQTNLLNNYRANQAVNGYQNTQNYNNTVTTTTTTNSVQNPHEPVRTYVPSSAGVQITNGEDATAADEAMRRADIAEQQALQTLKMR